MTEDNLVQATAETDLSQCDQLHAEDFDPYDGEDLDCWNCGGEGYVSDCIDGFCQDAESGCDLCTRRCDVCRPAPPQRSGDRPVAPNDGEAA
jgi:hypothetical protein